MDIIVHILTPLMTAVDGRRDTADKQYNTNPPFGVLDAFRHVASSFWSLSSIQCLKRELQVKTPSTRYTPKKDIPSCHLVQELRQQEDCDERKY